MSQIDGPLPSAVGAPSIWYDAAAAPQTKPFGNSLIRAGGLAARARFIAADDTAAAAAQPRNCRRGIDMGGARRSLGQRPAAEPAVAPDDDSVLECNR